MAKTFNTTSLAITMGKTEGNALAISAELHAHWLTLDDDAEMKADYCVGYIMGLYGIKESTAREWAGMTRKERNAVPVQRGEDMATAERLWNNASSNYDYRVVRNSGRVLAVAKIAEEPKLTRAQRAAIKACMELGITMKLYGQGVALLK